MVTHWRLTSNLHDTEVFINILYDLAELFNLGQALVRYHFGLQRGAVPSIVG